MFLYVQMCLSCLSFDCVQCSNTTDILMLILVIGQWGLVYLLHYQEFNTIISENYKKNNAISLLWHLIQHFYSNSVFIYIYIYI